MLLLQLLLASAAVLVRVSSEAVLFPTCLATDGCELASGEPTAPFDLGPVSASLFHLDLPVGAGLSDVRVLLEATADGGPPPVVVVQPWLPPLLMMFASGAPPQLSALCGEPLPAGRPDVPAPPPGRLFVAVANGNLTHAARGLRLTATAAVCPDRNSSGTYCVRADAEYAGRPVHVPLPAQPWRSPRPAYAVEFGPAQFPAEFWETVEVSARIVGGRGSQVPLDARPTVALDYGSVAPEAGIAATWGALTHAACGPADWSDSLECSASIRTPKRGRYYVSVFPSGLAPPPANASVEFTVRVAAMPASATARLEIGAAAALISPQLEARALFFDVSEDDGDTFTLLVCNDRGQLFGGIGIGASEGGLPALNRGAEFCELFSDDETEDAHYFFDQTAPGRYFVQLANVPVDGTWNVRVVPGRQDCA